MRACNSGERASSGRNTREEVPVGSAAADAPKSEHACRIRLARRAMSHHFPGVLAVLEAQSGSSQGGRLDSRTNFRKQLVAAIRPSLGQLRVEACDRRIALDPEPPSVARRMERHDARWRALETVCADLVALSCEQVLHGSPPRRAPVRGGRLRRFDCSSAPVRIRLSRYRSAGLAVLSWSGRSAPYAGPPRHPRSGRFSFGLTHGLTLLPPLAMMDPTPPHTVAPLSHLPQPQLSTIP